MRSAAFLTLLSLPTIALAMPPGQPPTTARSPVTDRYHQVEVVDEYRWLEDGTNQEVRQWSGRQNAFAREYLQTLPNTDLIRARVQRILAHESASYGSLQVAGGRYFAIQRQPPKQQPFLIELRSLDDPGSARVLLDPAAIDREGTTRIDWFVPSPDGLLVAVSMSRRGTESGDVHMIRTADGARVHEVIPRVNGGTAGGDLAWLPDSSGFYYTRYPRGQERSAADLDFYQQVYLHRLGEPTERDRYELGEDLPRIAEIQLDADQRTGRVIATVQDGDGGQFAHYLRDPDGRWRQFSHFGDRLVQAVFGPGDDLLVVSRQDAPRGKVLRLAASHLDCARADTIIPEDAASIVTSFWGSPSVLFSNERLFVTYQLGGPSELRVFTADGQPSAAPRQPPVASVGGLTATESGDVSYQVESFTQPGRYVRFQVDSGRTADTGLVNGSPVDLGEVSVVREMATSRDGTQVPLNILLPPGAKAGGNHPCLVTGYGGYGISLAPRFRPLDKVLLEHGVVLVVANLRGGGEFGEAWHRGGNLTNKQNVFDDFAAVLSHLITRGYTSSQNLAIIGGSNGGLLMGATLTQHPDLVRAVVSKVGIYDMLRVELSANGAFNIPEFGTVKDQRQFQALHAYSPYHAVRDGARYPATLLTTGENDPRVDPMQSRKMAARLQAANAAETPILLRTNARTGHGGDASLDDRIEEEVDVLAFLFSQLGVRVLGIE
ncbi:MAG: S9 family peptidase [Pirellulaceae bacterium]|nr:S9 family peptidase [Pirellulaceae bacterium]